jgi:hypothetical protein
MRHFSSYGPVDPTESFCVERREMVEACVQQLVADRLARAARPRRPARACSRHPRRGHSHRHVQPAGLPFGDAVGARGEGPPSRRLRPRAHRSGAWSRVHRPSGPARQPFAPSGHPAGAAEPPRQPRAPAVGRAARGPFVHWSVSVRAARKRETPSAGAPRPSSCPPMACADPRSGPARRPRCAGSGASPSSRAAPPARPRPPARWRRRRAPARGRDGTSSRRRSVLPRRDITTSAPGCAESLGPGRARAPRLRCERGRGRRA